MPVIENTPRYAELAGDRATDGFYEFMLTSATLYYRARYRFGAERARDQVGQLGAEQRRTRTLSPLSCEVRRTHPGSCGGFSTRGGAIPMDYPSETTIESIC